MMPKQSLGMDQGAIVFYDGGCGLCNREIQFYRRLDKSGRVDWVDINTNMHLLEAFGVTYEQAMRRFHVLDRNGVLQNGAPAFLAVWRELDGFNMLSRLVYMTRTVGLLDWLYGIFSKWRYRSRNPMSCSTSENTAI